MICRDQNGFYAAGIGLSLVTAALVAAGFVFLSFMKITMVERADMELHQEVDDAMRMVAADAEESASYRLFWRSDTTQLIFKKAHEDAGGERSRTYAVKHEGTRMKFCRSREAALQPLTGESEVGDVTVEEFRTEELRPGCLHVVLTGRSQRTGHAYRQTAEFALERAR